MFDPWAGIGSQQGRSTMRYDKQKNLYESNNDINHHRLYGYVDSVWHKKRYCYRRFKYKWNDIFISDKDKIVITRFKI